MTDRPIRPRAKISCTDWLNKESKEEAVDNNKKWFDSLDACPRKPTSSTLKRKDSDFARAEVQQGLVWKYDTCCSDVKNRHVDGFCSKCEFNQGADFCIVLRKAIKVEFRRDGLNYSHETSNQCCYDHNGSLITDPDKGAGRASKEINSPYNAIAHYQSDIAPYLSCCCSCKNEDCRKFMKLRPVVTGEYAPTFDTMAIVRGDPHFRTLDGLEYTFNGLGVYTLMNVGRFAVKLQVRMRRLGNGTVLSGFAMSNPGSLVEGYLPPGTDQLEVKVNRKRFELHQFDEFEQNGVEIVETSSSEFFFKLVRSGLPLKVMITDSSILNVAPIPPLSMVDDAVGLLGDFDGNSKNDLHLRSKFDTPSMDILIRSWKNLS